MDVQSDISVGVPQGAGVSPVLANVYLHELDKFYGRIRTEI